MKVFRSHEQWRDLFDEQAHSGLTISAFCAERGLNPGYFSKRRKELGVEVLSNTTGSAPSAFVPVRVSPHEGGREPGIELCVGAVRVILPATTSAEWLSDLVRQLQA